LTTSEINQLETERSETSFIGTGFVFAIVATAAVGIAVGSSCLVQS